MRKVVGAFAMALVLAPAISGAATLAELQAQVQMLLTRVATLQTQQSGSVLGTTTFCPNLYRTLSYGMRGNDVKELQQFLIQQKYLGSGYDTGYFLGMTQTAVQKFQCAHMNLCSGSPRTNGYGQVGPGTRAKIVEVCSVSNVPPLMPPPVLMSTPTPTPPPVAPPPAPLPTPTPPPGSVPMSQIPVHSAVLLSPSVPPPILLASRLEDPATTAFNASWAALPKRSADIPRDSNGNVNYYSGATWVAPAGYAYGGSGSASSNAFVILPPGADNDLIKVYFASIPNLSKGAQWTLELKTGLQGDAPAGTKATLRIGVAADKLNPNDEPWAYLATQEVVAGQAYTLSVPVGTWPLRDNFVLIFEGVKSGPNNYFQGIFVDDARLQAARAMPWNSVARSNLMWEPVAAQDKVINALAQVPSDWHRDGIRSSALADTTAQLMRRIQDQGKRILVNVFPDAGDYPAGTVFPHAGSVFKQKCGWSEGATPLSTIDYGLYEKRLADNLRAFQKAGVQVEAFEIGNEIDWVCFNGDLPLDRVANQAELDKTVRAYAAFLASSVKVINQYYPSAMTVSAGMSVHPGNATTNPGSISRPGQIIKALANVDGKNYLPLLDRIGIHFYRNPDDTGIVTSDLVGFEQDAGFPGKQYWVTEWGYPVNQFPTPQGRSRYAAFVNFLNATTQLSAPVVGNVFVYALDDANWGGLTLVDSNYNLLTETSKFFGKF